jgi:chromosome segregation ATPase
VLVRGEGGKDVQIDFTIIIVGLFTLCGQVATGLLTVAGVIYGTAVQRNRLHAETVSKISESKLTDAKIETEIQEALIRLNDELESKIKDLKQETKELREELSGVKQDRRILEERLMDVQRKYEAILQEYQALMAAHALKTDENNKLREELEEQRALLEDLKTSVSLQAKRGPTDGQ